MIDQEAIGVCVFCGGSGRLANPWCTGDQAGGWADTCDECDGSGNAVKETQMEPSSRVSSIFSLAFEQAERELGTRIGYPALVYTS